MHTNASSGQKDVGQSKKRTHKMKQLACAEQKEWVKKTIERLQKEGGKGSKRFYAKIRHAIWGNQHNSVRIGTKKGPMENRSVNVTC